MRYQKSILFLILLPAFIISGLEAQHAFPAVGGEVSGTGGTVSYTMGQVWYSTLNSNDGSVSQGVQQPYEILEITGLPASPGITLEASIFPNPAGEFIHLRVDDHSLDGLSYEIYNMQGEILEKSDITSNETLIPVSHLGVATYLIRITQLTDEIKIFKIIKK